MSASASIPTVATHDRLVNRKFTGDKGAAKGTDSKEGLRRVVSRRMLTFFIIGDILGTGIYALVGEVGGDVGGAIWMSFLVSVLVAFVTAFAYAELVTKYPFAAGAALY